MHKICTYFITFYFVSLGLSPLWGAHVHHTDQHLEPEAHGELHTEQDHHHETNIVKLNKQDHCVRHCQIESFLDHLLENIALLNTGDGSLVIRSNSCKSVCQFTLHDNFETQFKFVYVIKHCTPLILYRWQIHSINPRGPPGSCFKLVVS